MYIFIICSDRDRERKRRRSKSRDRDRDRERKRERRERRERERGERGERLEYIKTDEGGEIRVKEEPVDGKTIFSTTFLSSCNKVSRVFILKLAFCCDFICFKHETRC